MNFKTGITRGEFLALGAAASAAWLASPLRGFAVQAPSDARARISRIIQEYDAQGIHRTGTDVDDASGTWLQEQARAAGATAALERFRLARVELHVCTIGVGSKTVEGL